MLVGGTYCSDGARIFSTEAQQDLQCASTTSFFLLRIQCDPAMFICFHDWDICSSSADRFFKVFKLVLDEMRESARSVRGQAAQCSHINKV